MDQDYDGYITIEDILKYFENEPDINYNDLKKLMIDKDRKKLGKIDYADFSKWLGNAFHMPNGFYFRFNGYINPEQRLHLEKQKENLKDNDRKEASKALYCNKDFTQTVVDKIKNQWGQVKKAFRDLNVGRSGSITRDDLKYWLEFWGMQDIDEQKFEKCYTFFDLDKDGKISFMDF